MSSGKIKKSNNVVIASGNIDEQDAAGHTRDRKHEGHSALDVNA